MIELPMHRPVITDAAGRLDRPAGLYVHVPFCETKCGYCDFYSVALKDRDTSPLVDALVQELTARTEGNSAWIRTIFIGGGTPTILPLDQLEKLLRAVGDSIDVARVEEYTVEANPATVDDDKAALLVANGVTRVSMGAQSFFPRELATLERIHSPEDIPPSVAILRRHGIAQVNLDLIFGIPGQTIATWSESLRRAIELEPDHVAGYGLTFEPATRLTALHVAGKLTPCDEGLEADMFLLTADLLAKAGYRQYEISNYAQPGCECRHNLLYWGNEPYLGVGPSAAGCLPMPDVKNPKSAAAAQDDLRETTIDNRHSSMDHPWRRYKNVSDVAAYVRMMRSAGRAESDSEIITREAMILEMILMQLRLNEGLSRQAFRMRIGCDPADLFGATATRLVEGGLLRVTDGHVALTRSGRLAANDVMVQLAAAVDDLRVGGSFRPTQ
ncbi:MAG: radical SAM family heme chaperone HemW [Planctomycetota bacterium]